MDFHDLCVQILKEELVPALGCTEPIALAYGAARGREVLGEKPEHIEAFCNANIIKNVKGVVVPNCGGMKGIDVAVAAGALKGDGKRGLEVLSVVREEDLDEVRAFINENRVRVSYLDTAEKLHFILTLKGKEHTAKVEIKRAHTNIVSLQRDGEDVEIKNPSCEALGEDSSSGQMESLSVKTIVEFAETTPLDDIESILRPQVESNLRICEEGLENKWGASVGKTILEAGLYGSEMRKACALAAAGSDARMGGCSLPVVINSGSGNQGITVSMPVVEYGREHGIDEEKIIRALAISNLLAIYQKTQIGKLSAYCGAVCAACGAGAAITWLSGGGEAEIDETIVNTLATVSGMICDGAKSSCAGKIAVAVNAAFLGHKMAMRGRAYSAGDGIVKSDVDKTVSSVGTIAKTGMRDTDKVILSVMLEE